MGSGSSLPPLPGGALAEINPSELVRWINLFLKSIITWSPWCGRLSWSIWIEGRCRWSPCARIIKIEIIICIKISKILSADSNSNQFCAYETLDLFFQFNIPNAARSSCSCCSMIRFFWWIFVWWRMLIILSSSRSWWSPNRWRACSCSNPLKLAYCSFGSEKKSAIKISTNDLLQVLASPDLELVHQLDLRDNHYPQDCHRHHPANNTRNLTIHTFKTTKYQKRNLLCSRHLRSFGTYCWLRRIFDHVDNDMCAEDCSRIGSIWCSFWDQRRTVVHTARTNCS